MERDGWLQVEVRHLAALRAVAREGSFGAAATSLGYTQSAVSQQIATLERAVGERLVDRPGGPRPVSMTAAGEVLLRHAERVVAGMEAAWADLQALAAGDAGTLRVGTYQSVGARILPDLMRRFVAARPGVEVQLTESTSDQELLDKVERGDTDLSFTVLPLSEGPFEAVELMSDPYFVLVAAGSPLALTGRPPTWAEVAEQPLIGSRHCFAGEQIERLIQGTGVQLNVVFRSDDNGTVQGLVGAGMAAALMPALAVEPHDDQVVLLTTEEELPPRRIALAWHRHRALSPAARTFIDCAVELCTGLDAATPAPEGVGTIASG
ncbi:MAG TPA: LysR family transcriptional regulator [Miltoncostaeaceae bacterium]|jgi:DNA-binding transcriptional LysR family regulator|nr:LysR family transcriptional regulator [Miltoncostaeaceae bacterium]